MRVARLLSFASCLLAVALFSLTIGVTEAQAGKKLTLTVAVGAFDGPNPGTSGPFQIGGTIEGGGTFQCWGWVLTDGVTTLVSQVYELPGGQLMTQGIEGGLIAVTGGTGRFSNARGEGLQTFGGDGFTLDLELIAGGGAGS